ncbi:cytochrome c class I [Paracidovorax avenae ATCC 19860]|uniref:Cytochrome c class I n=1 Tax=Paracidovorax avenae (strain ATCC 19860 / DSM 7227 / CCUG 15838 / JCM 20985 / LMG 2117 / NCPPB 1011) TaxID=643561 RepID=F0QBJ2_PARA1|nr:c-type cytochrome [Paracidovorax avenae]ADX46157.1 cytochrome c class I [Paracidovorax avenae ATCC 19860]
MPPPSDAFPTAVRATGAARSLAAAALCLATALPALAGADAGDLVRDHGCMRCHAMVRTYVGPGFAEISERYRSDRNAETYLAGKIRNGGAGEWGRALMPRHPRIGEDEARSLARWILAQRKG